MFQVVLVCFNLQINEAQVYIIFNPRAKLWGPFSLNFIRVKKANGQTEFIPHSVKTVRGLQREKAR